MKILAFSLVAAGLVCAGLSSEEAMACGGRKRAAGGCGPVAAAPVTYVVKQKVKVFKGGHFKKRRAAYAPCVEAAPCGGAVVQQPFAPVASPQGYYATAQTPALVPAAPAKYLPTPQAPAKAVPAAQTPALAPAAPLKSSPLDLAPPPVPAPQGAYVIPEGPAANHFVMQDACFNGYVQAGDEVVATTLLRQYNANGYLYQAVVASEQGSHDLGEFNSAIAAEPAVAQYCNVVNGVPVVSNQVLVSHQGI